MLYRTIVISIITITFFIGVIQNLPLKHTIPEDEILLVDDHISIPNEEIKHLYLRSNDPGSLLHYIDSIP